MDSQQRLILLQLLPKLKQNNMRYTFSLIALFAVTTGFGQTDTLSLDTVLSWVKSHHPVVRSLTYKMNAAEAGVMAARGAFDPQAVASYGEKQFEGTQYYQYGEAGVNLPTWLGVDVYAKHAIADGYYLNPQATLPDEGMWRVGVDVPIGGELIWDERRAMLRDAQYIVERTEAEQRIAYSDVIFEVKLRYYEWAQKEAEFMVYSEVAELAEERFNLIKRAFLAGDRREMDTVESRIQWFNRKLKVQESRAAANTARAKLSAMLWANKTTPLEIPANQFPDAAEVAFVIPPDSLQMYALLEAQPQVAAMTVEVDRAMNKRRWARAKLWPDVSVNYNILRGGATGAEWNVPEQYQWGLKVKIPIFLREARGNAEAADSYYREVELKRMDAIQKAEAEMIGLQTSTYNLARQWLQAKEVYSMSSRLLDAERRRFDIGESSVFLVNSRENAMVQAAVAWFKIKTDYRVSIERQKRLVAAYWEE